ncbi:uncharacterized protein LOC121302265 [Polyodon spathula]|uniref:uncharacterized protein LOC121302265 n=1 Tax=Polyodon spathula TaxID=7913 RepID=UPI001B7E8667|nr:uncharacterized protein LOC121302265 [Polyodon spathula]
MESGAEPVSGVSSLGRASCAGDQPIPALPDSSSTRDKELQTAGASKSQLPPKPTKPKISPKPAHLLVTPKPGGGAPPNPQVTEPPRRSSQSKLPSHNAPGPSELPSAHRMHCLAGPRPYGKPANPNSVRIGFPRQAQSPGTPQLTPPVPTSKPASQKNLSNNNNNNNKNNNNKNVIPPFSSTPSNSGRSPDGNSPGKDDPIFPDPEIDPSGRSLPSPAHLDSQRKLEIARGEAEPTAEGLKISGSQEIQTRPGSAKPAPAGGRNEAGEPERGSKPGSWRETKTLQSPASAVLGSAPEPGPDCQSERTGPAKKLFHVKQVRVGNDPKRFPGTTVDQVLAEIQESKMRKRREKGAGVRGPECDAAFQRRVWEAAGLPGFFKGAPQYSFMKRGSQGGGLGSSTGAGENPILGQTGVGKEAPRLECGTALMKDDGSSGKISGSNIIVGDSGSVDVDDSISGENLVLESWRGDFKRISVPADSSPGDSRSVPDFLDDSVPGSAENKSQKSDSNQNLSPGGFNSESNLCDSKPNRVTDCSPPAENLGLRTNLNDFVQNQSPSDSTASPVTGDFVSDSSLNDFRPNQIVDCSISSSAEQSSLEQDIDDSKPNQISDYSDEKSSPVSDLIDSIQNSADFISSPIPGDFIPESSLKSVAVGAPSPIVITGVDENSESKCDNLVWSSDFSPLASLGDSTSHPRLSEDPDQIQEQDLQVSGGSVLDAPPWTVKGLLENSDPDVDHTGSPGSSVSAERFPSNGNSPETLSPEPVHRTTGPPDTEGSLQNPATPELSDDLLSAWSNQSLVPEGSQGRRSSLTESEGRNPFVEEFRDSEERDAAISEELGPDSGAGDLEGITGTEDTGDQGMPTCFPETDSRQTLVRSQDSEEVSEARKLREGQGVAADVLEAGGSGVLQVTSPDLLKMPAGVSVGHDLEERQRSAGVLEETGSKMLPSPITMFPTAGQKVFGGQFEVETKPSQESHANPEPSQVESRTKCSELTEVLQLEGWLRGLDTPEVTLKPITGSRTESPEPESVGEPRTMFLSGTEDELVDLSWGTLEIDAASRIGYSNTKPKSDPWILDLLHLSDGVLEPETESSTAPIASPAGNSLDHNLEIQKEASTAPAVQNLDLLIQWDLEPERDSGTMSSHGMMELLDISDPAPEPEAELIMEGVDLLEGTKCSKPESKALDIFSDSGLGTESESRTESSISTKEPGQTNLLIPESDFGGECSNLDLLDGTLDPEPKFRTPSSILLDSLNSSLDSWLEFRTIGGNLEHPDGNLEPSTLLENQDDREKDPKREERPRMQSSSRTEERSLDQLLLDRDLELNRTDTGGLVRPEPGPSMECKSSLVRNPDCSRVLDSGTLNLRPSPDISAADIASSSVGEEEEGEAECAELEVVIPDTLLLENSHPDAEFKRGAQSEPKMIPTPPSAPLLGAGGPVCETGPPFSERGKSPVCKSETGSLSDDGTETEFGSGGCLVPQQFLTEEIRPASELKGGLDAKSQNESPDTPVEFGTGSTSPSHSVLMEGDHPKRESLQPQGIGGSEGGPRKTTPDLLEACEVTVPRGSDAEDHGNHPIRNQLISDNLTREEEEPGNCQPISSHLNEATPTVENTAESQLSSCSESVSFSPRFSPINLMDDIFSTDTDWSRFMDERMNSTPLQRPSQPEPEGGANVGLWSSHHVCQPEETSGSQEDQSDHEDEKSSHLELSDKLDSPSELRGRSSPQSERKEGRTLSQSDLEEDEGGVANPIPFEGGSEGSEGSQSDLEAGDDADQSQTDGEEGIDQSMEELGVEDQPDGSNYELPPLDLSFMAGSEILDSSVCRNRARLNRKRGHRAPAFLPRHSRDTNTSGDAGNSWMFRDSTDPVHVVLSSDEDDDSELKCARLDPSSPSAPSASSAGRVQVLPVCDPTELRAQLRSRVSSADATDGEEPAESCGRQGDREGEESVISKADLSKRSKFMKLPTFKNSLLKRVLPGRGEKTERGERGSESSGTNWLQALKFKKKKPEMREREKESETPCDPPSDPSGRDPL